MQTFLTHYSNDTKQAFQQSARDLDRARLGKQRVEAYQILRTLLGEGKGWVNHPATKMWRGHETLLGLYHDIMIDEWVSRGYNNTMLKRHSENVSWPAAPDWFTPELVLSHQSNLVRKMPEHYQPLWPDVTGDLPYIWPV